MSRETNQILETTIEVLSKKYDSLNILCGKMDVSASWIFKSLKDGDTSIRTALKLEVLLEGLSPEEIEEHFDGVLPTWRDLAVSEAEHVEKVRDRY